MKRSPMMIIQQSSYSIGFSIVTYCTWYYKISNRGWNFWAIVLTIANWTDYSNGMVSTANNIKTYCLSAWCNSGKIIIIISPNCTYIHGEGN